MMRHFVRVMVLAATLGSIGCAMPKTPIYVKDKGIGHKFCTEVADHSQLISTQEFGVGVFMLTIGGASVTASGVLATVGANATEHRQTFGYVGAALAVAPLLMVPFGMILLSRSDEASALAAATNTSVALSRTDEDAYRDCVLAKAAWVGSRSDATALAREALEDQKAKDKEKADREKAKEKEKENKPEPAPDPEPVEDPEPEDDSSKKKSR